MINQTRKGFQFPAAIVLALLIILLGLLLNVTSVAALSSHSGYSTEIKNQAVPRIEPVDCSAFKGLDVSSVIVQCGYLIVPENRSNPQSRTLKVAYALIKAHGSNPQPDPVVYLTGGPGDNAIKWISDWAGKPMGENRDILLVDPRGLGYSQPTMDCPANNLPGISSQDTAPTAEDILAQDLQWAQSCRDLLASQGFDLTGYNSMASAGDLNDLRQALGYSQWNLFGMSYGTRLALMTMRAFPDGIRSVVLDSVLPPQDRSWQGDLTSTAGSFSALFAACKADAACDHDYPDLESNFYETIQRFNQNPARLTVVDGDSGKTKQVWITGAAVIVGIQQEMMYPYLIQIAPITINQVHAGDNSSLENLYSSLDPGMNWAFYNTVICHDASALFNPEQFHAELEKYPGLKSYYAGDEQETICRLWGAGQAGPAESQPVQSDIPTLLLTGGAYDPATPPANGKLAASTLTNHFLYEFTAYSHAVTNYDCPQAMLTDFLNNPSSAPDSSCMTQIKGLPFVTNVYLNSGALKIFLAVQNHGSWLPILIGIMGLLFLSTVIVLPVVTFRSRHKVSESQPLSNAARLILWIVALLNMGFGMGAWLLAKKALAENYGWVTLFGFSPRSSGTLFILPWLAALLTIALLAFTFLAWKNRWWGRPGRIFYSLGTLVAVGFTGILIFWKVLSL